MSTQTEQIREQQKETWNKFSPGWKKWDDLTMDFLKPMGDEIIRMIQPKDGDTVLDVAAGTGEPGLTIASMIPKGKVIVTDLAEGMLEIARENASKRGLKNLETKIADVCALPFPDNTFDAISCRFGYMFFPDMVLATKEMVRVLKPSGRIATSVWNIPEKNFWITASMGTINNIMLPIAIGIPPPPADAPGMFRCAGKGMMENLFRQAGLKNISEKEVEGKLKSETVDTYWSFITEVAAPVVAALGKADEATRQKIKEEVFKKVNQKYPGGNIAIDGSAIVICGQK